MSMFASLYRAMRDVGMPNPRVVDDLELWECAVLIGADGYEKPKTGSRDDRSHLHARVAYEEARAKFESGEGPEPTRFEWGDAPAEEMDLMSVLSSLGDSS